MNIKLRKYRLNDLGRHLELLRMNGVEYDNDFEERWLEKVVENYEKEEFEFYVLGVVFDGELVGNLVAENIDFEKKYCEIGFWIGKDYWRKGITSAALERFLIIMFGEFGMGKFAGKCSRENVASSKVFLKNGFKVMDVEGDMVRYEKKV
jgi:RimJ/RimL family protein N-acetyltransferase